MKKQINLLMAGMIAWGCWACSEDALTPSEPSHNFAARPEEPDYELRQKFFEEYNCYLIFNDTLRHDYVGTDEYGEAFYDTELLAPEWTFSGTEYNTSYRFTYFTAMEDKRKCAEFLAGVMESINRHNLTKPYAIFPVQGEIVKSEYDEMEGTSTETYSDQHSSLRCFILNLEDMDDLEVQNIAISMASSGMIEKYASELAPFYNLALDEYGSSLYGAYNYDAESEEDFYELGFLEIAEGEHFCSRKEDVAAYLELLVTKTPQEVEKDFRRYGTVLKKYAIIRELADRNNIKYNLKIEE